jgi:hypothetical protein
MREGKPSYLEVVDANLEIHEDPAGQPDEVRSVDQVGQAKKEHLLKEKVHPIHQCKKPFKGIWLAYNLPMLLDKQVVYLKLE